jgi:integrase
MDRTRFPSQASSGTTPDAQLLMLAAAKAIAAAQEAQAALAEHRQAIAAASAGSTGPVTPNLTPLADGHEEPIVLFCQRRYATAEVRSPATIKAALLACRQFCEAAGRNLSVGQVNDQAIRDYRTWLLDRVQTATITAWTANQRLAYLHAVLRLAAVRGLCRPLNTWERFDQSEPEAEPFEADQVAAMLARARQLAGDTAGVPSRIWWEAWLSLLLVAGCRITATMSAPRDAYRPAHGDEPATLFLDRQTQKQRQHQRLAIPTEAAEPVEQLLASHDLGILFPWDRDPARPGQERKWKALGRRFRRLICEPCGIELPRGKIMRLFRQTAGTAVEHAGGNPTALLGHSSPSIYKKHYQGKKTMPACREAMKVHLPRPVKDANQLSLW